MGKLPRLLLIMNCESTIDSRQTGLLVRTWVESSICFYCLRQYDPDLMLIMQFVCAKTAKFLLCSGKLGIIEKNEDLIHFFVLSK